ncbi:MAG TPA: hypothetical protein VHB79_36120 [Polyangiaceae bacterium]|nr:hypothetical protein [Polyangiaceae bacterium]
MSKAVQKFLSACDRYGGEPCAELRTATSAFLEAARADPELLTLAGRGFAELAPAPAAWLALTYGTAAETGFSPELTGAELLPAFDAWVARLPTASDGELSQPTREQEGLIRSFPFVCQAVVSTLARLPAQREARYRAERTSKRLDELCALTHGARWVREALNKSSGRLLVLHPESGRGVELSYQGVSNCFHLFTLLQGAIGTTLPGGRAPDADTLAAARGETDDDARDEAWWHYGDPSNSTPHIAASIWGEANPRDLPFLAQQTLLLWKPLLGSRSWDASFFRPQLAPFPPNARIERVLPEAEAHERLRALRIEPGAQ